MRNKFALNYIQTALIREDACVVSVFSLQLLPQLAYCSSVSNFPISSCAMLSHSICLYVSNILGESHNFFPFKSVQLRPTFVKDINLCGLNKLSTARAIYIALNGRMLASN